MGNDNENPNFGYFLNSAGYGVSTCLRDRIEALAAVKRFKAQDAIIASARYPEDSEDERRAETRGVEWLIQGQLLSDGLASLPSCNKCSREGNCGQSVKIANTIYKCNN